MTKTSSDRASLFERFTPMLLIVSVGLAFLVGVLWQKVSNLEKGDTGAVAVNPNGANAGPNNPPADATGKLSEEQAKKLPEVTSADYLLGSRDADVILIEYSDLECPFCVQFHPTGEKVVEEYKGKVAWVYRHFPLETLHPRALPSANAAECVGKVAGNDAFWKFLKTVFSDQDKYLSDSGLKEAALASGANGGAYDTCFSSGEFEKKVKDTASAGAAAGVTGTPANFIINKKGDVWLIPGALPFESLKTTIDEALNS